jgi:hypothetical protein
MPMVGPEHPRGTASPAWCHLVESRPHHDTVVKTMSQGSPQ